MNYGKYVYADYAIGGPFHRNNIMDVRTASVGDDEVYRGIFLFDESLRAWVERTKSVTGFTGKHISDMLLFDCDSTDLQVALDSAITIVNYLVKLGVDEEHISISFSGAKGFHIGLPFDLITEKVEPSETFWYTYKRMALELAQEIPHVDETIYEMKRIFRMPNTRNKKTGLFKIPLTAEELRSALVPEILELAKSKRKLQRRRDYTVNPILNDLYQKWKNERPNEEKRVVTRDTGPADLSCLLVGGEVGSRNNTATKLTGIFAAKGFSVHDTLAIVDTWNRSLPTPLPEKEVETTVRGVYERYHKKALDFEVYGIADGAEREYREFISNLDAKGNRAYLGIPKADERTRGLWRGETLFLLSRPSVGKTTVGQNIVQDFVRSTGEPGLFFSMEMPITGVYERAFMVEMGMSGLEVEEAFRMGDDGVKQRASIAFSKLKDFHVITKSGLTLRDIENAVKFCEEEVYHRKTGLVLVDYLGLVAGDRDIYARNSENARGSKDLAKSLGIPFIGLAQASRRFSEWDELDLGAAKDSGAFEDAADFLFGLWLNPNYKEKISDDMYPYRHLVLGMLKNRRGRLGKIGLKVDKRTVRMTESADDDLDVVEDISQPRYGGGKRQQPSPASVIPHKDPLSQELLDF